ncbi:MAG: MOSP complex formation periplasmic protein, TDE1658 family [Treponema sp.]
MKKLAAAAYLSLSMVLSIFAQSNLQPIAEVKITSRAPITLGQLKNRVSLYERDMGRKMSIEERKQTLDILINERIVFQASERDGIKITDSQVNNYFNQYLSNLAGREVSEAELKQMVEKNGMPFDEYMRSQTGMSLAEFKAFLKMQLSGQAYVMQKKEKELQSIPLPTDTEIRSQYELNKQSFVRPDAVKLFWVAAPKEGSSADAEKKIKDIQKQLSANPKNAVDIEKKSKEKKAGYYATEIFITKTNLAAEQFGVPLEELLKIFDMKINSVSAITQTPENFQCFMVMEKMPAKILELSDIVDPNREIILYDYLKNMMMLQKQNEALGNASIEIINGLRKPENFTIFKKDAELEKLLSW